MSDNFIPLNQSTPVQKWQNNSQSQRFFSNRYQQNGQRRGSYNNYNKWGNNSKRFKSFGSDSNSSYGNDSMNRSNIDAYLHPSMLQDPWAHLVKKNSG